MTTTPSGSLLQSMAAWAWETSLHAAVLVGLILLAQILFRKWLRPNWGYWLWLLVVIRLLMPVVPSSKFSIFNLQGAVAHLFPGSASPSSALSSSGPTYQRPLEREPMSQAVSHESIHPSRAQLAGAENQSPDSFLMAVLPWFWLMGVVGYFLAVFVQHQRLAVWVRRQTPVNVPRLMELLENAKATLGLKQNVRIVETTCLRTPALFGLRRPCLLLPKAMIRNLSDQELRLIILHELVHLKRRDVALNWLLVLVQSLHWFNPVVWLALRRLRVERELVCDAIVLSCLASDERPQYGSTLIKVLDYVSRPSLAPTLVPVINRKHEIQRRISMIARFKSTPLFISIASALLLLAVASFTFTGAAEKDAPPKIAETPSGTSDLEKQRALSERSIKVLEEEWAKQGQAVQQLQHQLDKMKIELSISELEEAGPQGQPETLRKMEEIRLAAQAEYVHAHNLYQHLTNLSRVELKRALPTAYPDQPLTSLLDRYSVAEQRLAELMDNYASGHPDVKTARTVLKTIQMQINERVDGILEGLKVRTLASKARLERLEMEVAETRKMEIDLAIRRRPYFRLKRDLETQLEVRDRLWRRIIQEKVDLAIPKQ